METFPEARPRSPFGPCWDDYANARARFFEKLRREPNDRCDGAVASPPDAGDVAEPGAEAGG